jgi:hypothetical protein
MVFTHGVLDYIFKRIQVWYGCILSAQVQYYPADFQGVSREHPAVVEGGGN